MDLDATVRDLAPRLLGYCRLASRDQSLAEEVCQDTLAALVQRWRRHGPPDSPAAFAFTIARRRCSRSAVRRRLLLPLERVLGRDNGRPSPEQEMLLAARRHGLLRSLARLSGKDRQVLLLLSVGGLRTEEAARALSISISAVKMRALRARQRLRELLEEMNGRAERRP